MSEEFSFERLVGNEVIALIPIFDKKLFQTVTIRGVEHGGLWIESETVTKFWVDKLDVPIIKTPIFFIPFNQITFAFSYDEKLQISEKKFGL